MEKYQNDINGVKKLYQDLLHGKGNLEAVNEKISITTSGGDLNTLELTLEGHLARATSKYQILRKDRNNLIINIEMAQKESNNLRDNLTKETEDESQDDERVKLNQAPADQSNNFDKMSFKKLEEYQRELLKYNEYLVMSQFPPGYFED